MKKTATSWERLLETISADDMKFIFNTPDDALGITDDILEVIIDAFSSDKTQFTNQDVFRCLMAIRAISRFESLISNQLFYCAVHD